VTRTRLLSKIRLVCVVAALVSIGFPMESRAAAAQSSAKKTAKAPVKRTSSAAARARRARAAAAARSAREAQEPHFKLDETGALVPDLRAAAAIIYDPQTGEVLWEENSTAQRSIASITKVMTAIVFLESKPDLTKEVVVLPSDVRAASTTHIRSGYRLTTDNLLHLMLIASDNAAARALARVSSYGAKGFIERMNERAHELGLENTSYADPSGLLAANVSSAYDMARLIAYAGSTPQISEIMQTANYNFNVGRQTISVHSTNQLVMKGDVDVLGGKTGFISKAGYCLATLLRLPQGGPQVAVVVLGAQSSALRFWETRHLFNWFSAKAGQLFDGATATAAASGLAN
jgi:D-alanyl-D-alanine endopeptidase (penicillin-binding protein 7)